MATMFGPDTRRMSGTTAAFAGNHDPSDALPLVAKHSWAGVNEGRGFKRKF